ncbi:MAG: hypothetical protein WC819_01480 [Parcubacteria group bacterium]|jgi:hypothetical protein
MKHEIKAFVESMTRKQTQDLFTTHVVDVSQEATHVVIWVDNVQPLHELSHDDHDEQIKKAVDHVCGEGCTYEVKVHKGNMVHERSNHVQRHA